jgi:hypothetical protein
MWWPPPGLSRHRLGVDAERRSTVPMSTGTPASFAKASRCRTLLRSPERQVDRQGWRTPPGQDVRG